jgi:hypothetical protein
MDSRVNSLTEGNLSVPVETITQTIAAARVESSLPLAYRLIRRNDGNGGEDHVLQGLFTWHQGCEQGGEWRDLETQTEPYDRDEVPFPGLTFFLDPERLSALHLSPGIGL